MNKVKEYHPAIDLLRIISILAVVLIHTTTKFIEVTHIDYINIQWTLLLNQLSRFAVPLFFIVSGFVLELSYKSHTSFFSYFKKRVNRILIPYIVWSVIYYYFIYTKHSNSFFVDLLNGDASYQLYFLPTIFIFYLLFPLLHSLYKVISNRWVIVFLAIIQIGILYYDYFVKALPFSYPISVSLLNYFYFVVGIIVSRNNKIIFKFIEKWRYILIACLIAFGMYVFLEGQGIYKDKYNYIYIYSQWRPSVFAYSITFASVIYYYTDRTGISNRLIKKLSSLSFFVFFIHVIILELIWSNVVVRFVQLPESNNLNQLYLNLFFFMTVVSTSFLIAYLVHKVPKLSKVTG